MTTPEQPDSLTPEERQLFARLPQEVAPPSCLERSVTDALEKAGHLGAAAEAGRRSFRLASLLRPAFLIPRALAAAALVVLGVWIGRREAGSPAAVAPTFALLLYEGKGFEPATPANYPARYEDYNRWITPLRASRQFVDGLQFDTSAVVLDSRAAGAGSVADDPLGSMFLIAAADLAGALGIAESIPHLRYGGRVAVRALVPVEPPAGGGGAP